MVNGLDDTWHVPVFWTAYKNKGNKGLDGFKVV